MSITHLVIHHSAFQSNTDQFDSINYWHKTRNWGTDKNPVYASKNLRGNFIQYTYLIERSGQIKQCRNEDEAGWHCGDREINNNSVSICLAGNFDIEYPNENQVKSLRELLTKLMEKHKIKVEDILYHRDIKPTHCPGTNIKDDFIKKLFMRYIIIGQQQYLIYEPLKLAFNIGDPQDLTMLMSQGLDLRPEQWEVIPDEYAIFNMTSQSRIRKLIEELKDALNI